MCFVWISEKAKNSDYSPILPGLVLIIQTECVYWAVRAASLNISNSSQIPSSKTVPWLSHFRRQITRRPGFDPRSVHLSFVVATVAVGVVFLLILRFSSVNIITVPNTQLHVALTSSTSGRSYGNLKSRPGKKEHLIEKCVHPFFLSSSKCRAGVPIARFIHGTPSFLKLLLHDQPLYIAKNVCVCVCVRVCRLYMN
jgi:hypothetical protein